LTYIGINQSANKLDLVKDVADGLQYLHSQNVIHGDLHCKNVLVDDTGHATLTDFGRAKVIGAVGYDTPILAGYAPYMAPELFPQSDVNIDQLFSQKSDVYAFGMLCFEVFTGEEPFACHKVRLDWQVVPLIRQGKRPLCTPRVQRHISQGMWGVMEACWNSAPGDRPSAEQIVRSMP